MLAPLPPGAHPRGILGSHVVLSGPEATMGLPGVTSISWFKTFLLRKVPGASLLAQW